MHFPRSILISGLFLLGAYSSGSSLTRPDWRAKQDGSRKGQWDPGLTRQFSHFLVLKGLNEERTRKKSEETVWLKIARAIASADILSSLVVWYRSRHKRRRPPVNRKPMDAGWRVQAK
ncbi:hypothetical protein B0H13DRAFT_1882088 [Mycena leptocephala]|nr:hypothetical protein B0H13DRAFT_1882088 [Mycena leptocephala]